MNILTVIIFVISASTAEDLHSINTQNKEREIALEEHSTDSTAQERIDQDAVPSCISKITADYARNTAPNFYNPLNYGKLLQAVPIENNQRTQHRANIRHNSGVGPVSSNFVIDQVEDRKSGSSVDHAERSYSSMIVKIGSSGEKSDDNKLGVSYGNGGVALSFSGNERAVEMVLSPPPSVMSQFLAQNVIDQQVSVPITRFARVPVPYAVSIPRSLPDPATQTFPIPNIGHAPVTVNHPTPILLLHPVTMPLPEPYGIPVLEQVRQPVSVSVPPPNVMQKSQSFMSPAGEGDTRAWYKEMTTPVSAQHIYPSQVYQAISKHRSAERDTYKTETGTSGMSESYLQLIMGSMPHNLGFNFNSLGYDHDIKTKNR